MSHSRTPKQRLPDHLRRANSTKGNEPQPTRSGASGTKATPRSTGHPDTAPPAEGKTDRLSELLPVILRASLGEREDRATHGAPLVIAQEDLLAALAPYYRPRSRFDQLMIRKLVGEGYLKPRGARDKHGVSAAYELTPKGERLLGLRRTR